MAKILKEKGGESMINNTTFSEIVFKNSQLLMKNQLKTGDRMAHDFWRSNEDQGQGYD